MHVEDQTREITEDKCSNDHDKDERQMLLLVSPPIPPPSNSKVYVDVKDGDGHKGKDTDDHQS